MEKGEPDMPLIDDMEERRFDGDDVVDDDPFIGVLVAERESCELEFTELITSKMVLLIEAEEAL